MPRSKTSTSTCRTWSERCWTPIPEPLHTFIPEQLGRNRIGLLPIELAHVLEVARLPLRHRDPFDRLLICQSIVEGLPILSADSAFDDYPVRRIW